MYINFIDYDTRKGKRAKKRIKKKTFFLRNISNLI